jgi:putative inorganic carbon (HCO3(-)) transporter
MNTNWCGRSGVSSALAFYEPYYPMSSPVRIPTGRPYPQTTAMQTGPASPERLYAMRIADIWGFIKTQPASFWFLNIYLFFEYVRPQQIYRTIDVLPWAWLSIWLTVAFMFIENVRTRRLYPADKMLIVFSAWLFVSMVTAEYPEVSFDHWSDYYSWILIYFLITNLINNERRYLVFLLAFLVYSTKMSQHGFRSFVERGGAFASYGASGAPGWFQNSGEFAIQMCIFFALSSYFVQVLKPHWSRQKLLLFLFMPVSAAVCLVASSSRGGVLGLIPVILWMLLKSRKRVKGLVLATVVGVSIWVLLPQEQKDRFSVMGEDDTSQSRLAYWEQGLDMMRNHPITGIGFKNWMGYSVTHYPPFISTTGWRPMWQLPHNIFIEVGAELGYTGLLLFFGLIGMTLYTNHRTRKLSKLRPDGGKFATAIAHGLDAGMFGYLAAGFFVTVFYYPFFWINYAFTVALHHIVATGAAAGAQPSVTTAARR